MCEREGEEGVRQSNQLITLDIQHLKCPNTAVNAGARVRLVWLRYTCSH